MPSSSSVSAPDAFPSSRLLGMLYVLDAGLSGLLSFMTGAGDTLCSTTVFVSSFGEGGRGVRSRADVTDRDSDISRSATSIASRTRLASAPTSSVVRSAVGMGLRTDDEA
jgi:hypothetical protein